ncbi:MAG: uroporphyrinogen decarboxylase/cobalamine-independent methonine synthase family protein, partial [Anaerolineae bacterium]
MDIRRAPSSFQPPLTSRERFLRCMHYQQVDYIPHLEFGYWDELKDDWMAEGHLPLSMRQPDGSIPDHLVEMYFGVEQFAGVGPRIGTLPLRPIQVIEETAATRTYRDGLGVLSQVQTQGTHTIPHFLEFPIRDRATWQAFRDEFLDVNHPSRVLSEPELARMEHLSRTSDRTVAVWFGSFIGWVRDWTGFQNLAYLSVDDPDLVEEMVAHLAQMALQLLEPVLERCQVDAGSGWEDICFNSGPILSPRFFAERIMPHVAQVVKLMRQHGIDIIYTDCDGNILKLIPQWLAIGQNAVFPLEVNPGNDPVALKREYGRDLLIRGGFNKFALHQGREGVLAELKRLEPAVIAGGFAPGVDHRCPGQVPWDTYCYYIWEKCHLLGWPEDVIKAFPAFEHWRP